MTVSLKYRGPAESGAVNEAVALVAPVSVTRLETAVVEVGPSTWVHRQVTLSPHAPVAVPDSVTSAPVATAWSAPAFATGRNGAPGLSFRNSAPNTVSRSKTFAGSEVSSLPLRASTTNAVSSSKTFAGSSVRPLLSRNSNSNTVRLSKTFAGSSVRPLLLRRSASNAVRLSKTFAGSEARLLPSRVSVVNAVRLSKTFAGSEVRLLPFRPASSTP